MFPASTPAGAGGFQPFTSLGEEVTLTSVVSQLGAARDWSINGSGDLVANGTPDVDDGVIIVCGTAMGPVAITIDATIDGEAVATWTEMFNLWGTPSRLSGKTHILRCRDFNIPDGTNVYGRHAATSLCTWRPERLNVRRPLMRGQFAINGNAGAIGNALFEDINFFLPQADDMYNPIEPLDAAVSVVNLLNTVNTIFRRCEIYSDLEAAGTGYRIKQPVHGASLYATDSSGLEDCEIHRVFHGVIMRGVNPRALRNDIHHIWGDAFNFVSPTTGTIRVEFNDVHDFMGDTGQIHQDVFQVTGNIAADFSVIGNVEWPGPLGQVRPGADGGNTINLGVNTTLTAAQSNSLIRATADGLEFTLPDPALCDDRDFVFTTSASGHTLSIVAANAAHFDGDILPATAGWSVNELQVSLKAVDGKWVARPSGTRTNTILKSAGFTLNRDMDQNRTHHVATGGSTEIVTLPASPTTGDKYTVGPDDAGTVTVQATGAAPMSRYGVTGLTEWSMVGLLVPSTFTYDGSGWVVTDAGFGTQGFFANSFVFGGEITFAGNYLWTSETWAFRIEGDADLPDIVTVAYNALLLPRSAPLAGETGTYANRMGMEFGTEGTIEARRTTTAIGNISNKLTQIGTGAVLADNVTMDLGLSDSASLTGHTTHFDGSDHADFFPMTRAEAIKAYKTGAPKEGVFHGPLSIIDFTNRQIRTDIDDIIVTANEARSSATVATFTTNQMVQFGTGNVSLWNVTDAVLVETFNVAASGLVAITGLDLTITPTSPLATGKTYSLRADATALMGRFGSPTFAGLAADTVSFPLATPVLVTPVRLLTDTYISAGAGVKIVATDVPASGLHPIYVDASFRYGNPASADQTVTAVLDNGVDDPIPLELFASARSNNFMTASFRLLSGVPAGTFDIILTNSSSGFNGLAVEVAELQDANTDQSAAIIGADTTATSAAITFSVTTTAPNTYVRSVGGSQNVLLSAIGMDVIWPEVFNNVPAGRSGNDVTFAAFTEKQQATPGVASTTNTQSAGAQQVGYAYTVA